MSVPAANPHNPAPSPSAEQRPCQLCGLPVGKAPLTLADPAGPPAPALAFCCEGCLGIYQMLHEINTPLPGGADNGPGRG